QDEREQRLAAQVALLERLDGEHRRRPGERPAEVAQFRVLHAPDGRAEGREEPELRPRPGPAPSGRLWLDRIGIAHGRDSAGEGSGTMRSSEAIRPSRILTTRWQRAATSGSWVTMTIVWPSRCSAAKRS